MSSLHPLVLTIKLMSRCFSLLPLVALVYCTLAAASPVPVQTKWLASKSSKASPPEVKPSHASSNLSNRQLFDLNRPPLETLHPWEAAIELHRDKDDPHPANVIEARLRDSQHEMKSRKITSKRKRIHNELVNHYKEKSGYYYSPRLQPKAPKEPLNYHYHITGKNRWKTIPSNKIDYDVQPIHPHQDHPEQAAPFRSKILESHKAGDTNWAAKYIKVENSKVKEEALKHIAIGGVVEIDNTRQYMHHAEMTLSHLKQAINDGHIRQLRLSETKFFKKPRDQAYKVFALTNGKHRNEMDQLAYDAQVDAIKHLEEIKQNPGRGRHYENEDGEMTEHDVVSTGEAPEYDEWNPFQDRNESESDSEVSSKVDRKGKGIKRSKSPSQGQSSGHPSSSSKAHG
jgi:hypothetical protein